MSKWPPDIGVQHAPFIAERTLHALATDGRSFEIRLGIGKPYQISTDEWGCPVQVRGLYAQLSDAYGIDSWQALQLACELAARLLGNFVEDGGRLFWEEGGEQMVLSELFAKSADF